MCGYRVWVTFFSTSQKHTHSMAGIEYFQFDIWTEFIYDGGAPPRERRINRNMLCVWMRYLQDSYLSVGGWWRAGCGSTKTMLFFVCVCVRCCTIFYDFIEFPQDDVCRIVFFIYICMCCTCTSAVKGCLWIVNIWFDLRRYRERVVYVCIVYTSK